MVARVEPRQDEKSWFLRGLLVLQHPRPVFAALRDDSDEVAAVRQDTAGAIVWLAGIATILAAGSTVRDDVVIDGSLFAVWAFLAGGLYGFVLYFAVGKLLHVSLRRLGGRGSFRRARHLLAFAAAPIALALFVYWPIRMAIYGENLFRSGGADGRGAGPAVAWLFYGFVAWAVVLLVVGVRTVHGWTWSRSVAGVAVTAAFGGVLAVGVSLLHAFG